MVEFILPNDIDENLSRDTGKEIIIDNVTVTERLQDDFNYAAVYIYLFRLSINGDKKVIPIKMPVKFRDVIDGTNIYPMIYKALVDTIKEGKENYEPHTSQ